MTIEFEAGASQSQCSMKPLVVHAFFVGQPWNGRLSTTDADLAQQGPSQKSHFVFQGETPSLSLRLMSVRRVSGRANATRTRSNRVRVCSTRVRSSFDHHQQSKLAL
jgi:hypothetical protein